MTPIQKRAFVDELINHVHNNIVEKIEAMPDDWDGHELRRFIADKFDDAAMTIGREKFFARRFRAYKKEVILRNL